MHYCYQAVVHVGPGRKATPRMSLSCCGMLCWEERGRRTGNRARWFLHLGKRRNFTQIQNSGRSQTNKPARPSRQFSAVLLPTQRNTRRPTHARRSLGPGPHPMPSGLARRCKAYFYIGAQRAATSRSSSTWHCCFSVSWDKIDILSKAYYDTIELK